MLVYADRSERQDPRHVLDALARDLAALETHPAGLARHSRLVGALIEAGRLLQGVADADFAAAGLDRASVAGRQISLLVHQLAQAVCRSWRHGRLGTPRLPPVPQVTDLPDTIRLRAPEGYAFYALYPEAYAEAARRLRLIGPPRVIGIRSIGTSLAAIVAAAIDAPLSVTVRPFGDPCDRQVALSPELAAAILAPANAHYVIVDEGPGRSGSSFGAVAAWLEARGVAARRISFVTSHPGMPGPDTTPVHQARWARVDRVTADFGDRLPALLTRWSAALLGRLDGPLTDISAGRWRRHVWTEESAWPAVDAAQERRKYLVRAGGTRWLIKFAGLGATGARTLARARTLHAAGWTPEPRGLVHGFLVERWHEDRRVAPPRPDAIARYIGTRARLFRADPAQGASLAELLEMSRRNIGLALGDAMASTLGRWTPRLSRLAALALPIATDNRLDPHEWLRLPDGRLLKADALDHHAGHDLIGCQDMAWDVAGAGVELGLPPRAARALAAAVGEAAGRPVDRELTDFLTTAYLAFRLGQTTLAADGPATGADAARLRRKARLYADTLEQRLHQPADPG